MIVGISAAMVVARYTAMSMGKAGRMRILATSLLNLVAIAVIAGPEGTSCTSHDTFERGIETVLPAALVLAGGIAASTHSQCGAGAAVVAAVFSLAGARHNSASVCSGVVSTGAALVVVGGVVLMWRCAAPLRVRPKFFFGDEKFY